jgi:3,4-dihydroxy 2-butanone 4-phosphate synthase/GTP cyclohydrolase II
MHILTNLGVRDMRLLTNNPAKRARLEGYGLTVSDRIPLVTAPNPENIRYLSAKREKMGHALEGIDGASPDLLEEASLAGGLLQDDEAAQGA